MKIPVYSYMVLQYRVIQGKCVASCIGYYQYMAIFHGLTTPPVPLYNISYPKSAEQWTVCKPRRIKCFQTIFSNTFFPATTDLYLATISHKIFETSFHVKQRTTGKV